MKTTRAQARSRPYRATQFALMVSATTAIFLTDTATDYEVAVSVFYTVVILTSSRVLSQRALLLMTGTSIGITLLSFILTSHGDYRAGIVNLAISIMAILITGYLVRKMETARTAAHEAQARLLRIARGKSLEGLTTSIAHEVNQPLAAIVTSGNACQRWLKQEPPNLYKAQQALLRILDDAGRASSIIVRVRNLTKGESPDRTPFALNDATEEMIMMAQAEMRRWNITLIVDLTPDLPNVLADRVQIQQVMGNVILNAIEATAYASASKRVIRISTARVNNKLIFRISDSGIGLPAGCHEHLFEAFWTTKDQGIGVGLSISRTIIEVNGGHIWAEPNEHGGAVFAFSVPIASEQATR